MFFPTEQCPPLHEVKSFLRKEFQSLEHFLRRRVVLIAFENDGWTRD